MEQVWVSACMKSEIPDPVAQTWLDKIKTRMSTESGRIVHTWNDIVQPKAQYLSSENAFLVFAVCFQYFEFDVKRNCVEENCKAFRDFCKEAGFTDEACIRKVERLLGNDSAEAYAGLEDDMAIMQDVDLIVLGLPDDKYKNYTQLLRKEYPHLDDNSYKSMRLKASNSGLLPEQQHLRRRQDQPQDDHDSFFNRLAQPFKKIRDNLIFPYALRSVASSVSKPVISKDVQVLTTTERKRNALYSSNTFNPNKEKRLPGKRMIIIDGSNVAYAHSCNKFFSVKGIEIALQYFNKMGHEAKAVVPQHRLRQAASSDPELLASLHRQGKIVLTPCKNLQGKSTVSYDDRFILQLAVEFDAAVVSNDNFNDLVTEHPAFRKVIESRVIGYTWCKDVFMLPKDPYGRNGPSLSVILNRI